VPAQARRLRGSQLCGGAAQSPEALQVCLRMRGVILQHPVVGLRALHGHAVRVCRQQQERAGQPAVSMRLSTHASHAPQGHAPSSRCRWRRAHGHGPAAGKQGAAARAHLQRRSMLRLHRGAPVLPGHRRAHAAQPLQRGGSRLELRRLVLARALRATARLTHARCRRAGARDALGSAAAMPGAAQRRACSARKARGLCAASAASLAVMSARRAAAAACSAPRLRSRCSTAGRVTHSSA